MTGSKVRPAASLDQLRSQIADLKMQLEEANRQLAELNSGSEARNAGDAPDHVDSETSSRSGSLQPPQQTRDTGPARRTEVALRDISDRMASVLASLETNAQLLQDAQPAEPSNEGRSLERLNEAQHVLQELLERQLLQMERLRAVEARRRESSLRRQELLHELQHLERALLEQLERHKRYVQELRQNEAADNDALQRQERVVAHLRKAAQESPEDRSLAERLRREQQRLQTLSARHRLAQTKLEEGESRLGERQERLERLQETIADTECLNRAITDRLATAADPSWSVEPAEREEARRPRLWDAIRRRLPSYDIPDRPDAANHYSYFRPALMRSLLDSAASWSSGLEPSELSTLTWLLTRQRARPSGMSESESAVVALALTRFLHDHPGWSDWGGDPSCVWYLGRGDSKKGLVSIDSREKPKAEDGHQQEDGTRKGRDE